MSSHHTRRTLSTVLAVALGAFSVVVASKTIDDVKIEGGVEVVTSIEETQHTNGKKLLEDAIAIGQNSISHGIESIGSSANAAFTEEESLQVLTRETAITNAQSDTPVLGSWGAGTCVIIILHNPATKEARVSHYDVNTHLDTLDKHIEELKKGGDDTLEIHLSGGDRGSEQMVIDILKIINQHKNVEIKSTDLFDTNGARQLLIDTRTGEIGINFSFPQLGEGTT